jgi:hypothetical protein
LKVGFQLLEPAEEAALGSGFVASEVKELPVIVVGPAVSEGRKIGFHFCQVFLIALEDPMSVGCLFNERAGDGIIGVGLIFFEPGIDGELEFNRIFVAKQDLLGAAAVGETVQAGVGFALRRVGTSAPSGSRLCWFLVVHVRDSEYQCRGGQGEAEGRGE